MIRNHVKSSFICCLSLACCLLFAPLAGAHFQTLLPSTDLITDQTGTALTLDMIFTHPMEQGPAMTMARPTRFGVLVQGKTVDLMADLKPITVQGKPAYRADYMVKAPGDYVFFIEPAPYWEPAEGKMIIHYTKVVVDAFGAEEGWDGLVGLPVEIEPLVRPYGLWAGNLFQGIVRQDGKPVPFAEVEVEYYNTAGIKAPADPFITQVIKADGNGVFSYAMPRAGWWAFAALVEAKDKMDSPEGKKVPVELGGLIWVKTVDMK